LASLAQENWVQIARRAVPRERPGTARMLYPGAHAARLAEINSFAEEIRCLSHLSVQRLVVSSCCLGQQASGQDAAPADWIDPRDRPSHHPAHGGCRRHQLLLPPELLHCGRRQMVVSTKGGLATIDLTTIGEKPCKLEVIAPSATGNPILGKKSRQIYYGPRRHRLCNAHRYEGDARDHETAGRAERRLRSRPQRRRDAARQHRQ